MLQLLSRCNSGQASIRVPGILAHRTRQDAAREPRQRILAARTRKDRRDGDHPARRGTPASFFRRSIGAAAHRAWTRVSITEAAAPSAPSRNSSRAAIKFQVASSGAAESLPGCQCRIAPWARVCVGCLQLGSLIGWEQPGHPSQETRSPSLQCCPLRHDSQLSRKPSQGAPSPSKRQPPAALWVQCRHPPPPEQRSGQHTACRTRQFRVQDLHGPPAAPLRCCHGLGRFRAADSPVISRVVSDGWLVSRTVCRPAAPAQKDPMARIPTEYRDPGQHSRGSRVFAQTFHYPSW